MNLIKVTFINTVVGFINLTPPSIITLVDLSQRKQKAKEVGFFNNSLEDPNNTPIITIGRYLFYYNIYIFINKLKDLTK